MPLYNPAKILRDTIADRKNNGPISDEELLAGALSAYESYREKLLDDLLLSNSLVRSTVYMSAGVLITFGYIDVAEDIFQIYPYMIHPLQAIMSRIPEIIPIPAELKYMRNRSEISEILKWVKNNKAFLQWDEQNGRYFLKKDNFSESDEKKST